MLNPIFVSATTLPDAWFQAIYQCIHHGRDFTIDRGSYAGDKRLEFDYFTAHIKNPGAGSDSDINLLLPHLSETCNIPNPVEDGYLDNYLSIYLMSSEVSNEESYTYGQRMTKYQVPEEWVKNWYRNDGVKSWKQEMTETELFWKAIEYIASGSINFWNTAVKDEDFNMEKVQEIIFDIYNKATNSPTSLKPWNEILIQDPEFWENPEIIIRENGKYYVNQIKLLIETYKNKGFRNNQMVLQVAHPIDMLLQDPPCLRLIDTRIQKEADGKTYLHFFPEFRSWDLWGGFPANLGGIELMKQLLANEIGVENGEMIVRSKGLHIYKYVWELAEAIAHKTIEEARACILTPEEIIRKTK